MLSNAGRVLLLVLSVLLGLGRGELESVGLVALALAHLFPRAVCLEVSECLGELQWFADDSLLLLVVSDLCVTCEGEVLTQGVTLETVIGQDSPEIRVTDEEDTVHVPNFTFVPVGGTEHTGGGGDWVDLVSVSLDTDSCVVLNRKKVVNHLESLRTSGVIGTGNVHACSELSLSVVPEESKSGNHSVWCDVECEFVLNYAELLNELGETCKR